MIAQVTINDVRVARERIASGILRTPCPLSVPLSELTSQGTMALEILEDVPEAGVLVVPTGGAGLLAGVGIVAKALRPDITIVAVEPAAAPAFSAAQAAGAPVSMPIRTTLADGLAVGRVGLTHRR
jgi:threonine dehydratase